MSYRRRESIEQDIGEKYTELCSIQTTITGKLFCMSCFVLTMADSLMCSSTESTTTIQQPGIDVPLTIQQPGIDVPLRIQQPGIDVPFDAWLLYG
jgi:hypothetical protein